MTIKVDWTADLKAEARALYQSGLSFTAITEELWLRHPRLKNVLTRNAVIGKVHRMQIKRLDPILNPPPAPLPLFEHVPEPVIPPPPVPEPLPAPEPLPVPEPIIPPLPPLPDPPSLKEVSPPTVPKQRRAPVFQPKTTYPTTGPKMHDGFEPKNLSIYQLNEHRCKWPLGKWDAPPPYLYCGHASESGTPYCPHHNDIALNKDPRVFRPRAVPFIRAKVASR